MSKQAGTTKTKSRLAGLRARRKLTQEQLGEMIGANREKIAKLERGDIWYSLDSATQISRALNCGMWELMPDAPDLTQDDLRILAALHRMNEDQKMQFLTLLETLLNGAAPDRQQ
jgi:transcriptional regulator with XRE-family HTH domain